MKVLVKVGLRVGKDCDLQIKPTLIVGVKIRLLTTSGRETVLLVFKVRTPDDDCKTET